jgi:hypothetical protein
LAEESKHSNITNTIFHIIGLFQVIGSLLAAMFVVVLTPSSASGFPTFNEK